MMSGLRIKSRSSINRTTRRWIWRTDLHSSPLCLSVFLPPVHMSFTNQWLTFRFLLSELTTVSGSLLSSKKSPIQHNLNSHHSSGAPNKKNGTEPVCSSISPTLIDLAICRRCVLSVELPLIRFWRLNTARNYQIHSSVRQKVQKPPVDHACFGQRMVVSCAVKKILS